MLVELSEEGEREREEDEARAAATSSSSRSTPASHAVPSCSPVRKRCVPTPRTQRCTRESRKLTAAPRPPHQPAPLIASTSRATAHLASPAPTPSTQPSHSRPFSSSAPAQESKARRKTRLVRKANLEKKVQLVRQHDQARPDPVYGHAKGNDDLWNKSLLNQILLRRDDVWGDVVQVDTSSSVSSPGAILNEQGQSSSSSSSTSTADGSPQRYTPKLFNFGLDAATAEQLSTVLPATSALRATLSDSEGGAPSRVDAVVLERFERATDAEQHKRDALMRIVDLRNADSKGIEVENTRRIAAAFGRSPGDTASPEVQGASPFSLSRSPPPVEPRAPPDALARLARLARSRHPDDAHPLPLGSPRLVAARRPEPPGSAPPRRAPRKGPQVPARRQRRAVRGVPRAGRGRAEGRRGRGRCAQGGAEDHDSRGVERPEEVSGRDDEQHAGLSLSFALESRRSLRTLLLLGSRRSSLSLDTKEKRESHAGLYKESPRGSTTPLSPSTRTLGNLYDTVRELLSARGRRRSRVREPKRERDEATHRSVCTRR